MVLGLAVSISMVYTTVMQSVFLWFLFHRLRHMVETFSFKTLLHRTGKWDPKSVTTKGDFAGKCPVLLP